MLRPIKQLLQKQMLELPGGTLTIIPGPSDEAIKEAGIQKVISNPFNTVYDVTPQTSFDGLPPGYYQAVNQQQKQREEENKALEIGLIELSKNPDIEELLLDQAHQTISKHDDHIIRIVFFTALSAYHKPLNLGLKAESGSGKTYSTLETIKFFPDEDIQIIGSQSPKVISHEHGLRKTADGEIIDEDNAPVKPLKRDYPEDYDERIKEYYEQKKLWEEKLKNSYYEVDIRNKCLAFLESINLETFKMFKTTMSHDHDYIDHKYVDEKGKIHVTRLVGAPAMIFNSVDNSYVEEFATRTFTATPSTRPEKIEESMQISNRKSCYPWIYEKEQFNRGLMKEYIRKIRYFMNKGRIRVATPFDGLYEGFSKEATRDMRDFNKFLELLPSTAIFKLFQRPIIMLNGNRYLIPTIQDALDAKAAFDSIIETTKTSTDNRIIEFYHKVVKNHEHGSTAEDLTDQYNKGRKRPLSVKRIREWLQRLEEIGYVDIRDAGHENAKGYIDRRYNCYYPLKNNSAPNTAILQIDVDLKPILEKSFETWLKNAPIELDSQIIILNIDGSAQQISIEEMKDIVNNTFRRESVFIGAFCKANSTLKTENKTEDTPITENAAKGAFSRYVEYEKIPRKPGVYCSSEGEGDGCTYEAEYNLNGNLYCETHFHREARFLQDNGTGLKEKFVGELYGK